MAQISIIIPVYGAENYLYRCLDSILAQTFTSWDCILVDDGSKDRSGIICDEYAQKDSRFRVFHKENGGVSSARQYGMERALESDSIYSIHVDPDDWVEPEMLERLLQKAEETGADMVICDYFFNTSQKQTYIKQDPGSEEPLQVFYALFQRLHGSLWNKLIKLACYKGVNIKFPVGLNYCEDLYVNICLLLKSVSKVAYLPEAFYHYDNYTNTNQETKENNSKKIDFTRTELVRLCRDVVADELKNFQYYLFEVNKAFSIIHNGSMQDDAYRSFFCNIPANLLLKRHHPYFYTLAVLLAARTPFGCHRTAAVWHSYIATRRLIMNLFRKIMSLHL